MPLQTASDRRADAANSVHSASASSPLDSRYSRSFRRARWCRAKSVPSGSSSRVRHLLEAQSSDVSEIDHFPVRLTQTFDGFPEKSGGDGIGRGGTGGRFGAAAMLSMGDSSIGRA